MTSAATTITVTAPRAAETGTPDDGVGAGGTGVSVDVGVEVGQGVMVGRSVGVPVGWVGLLSGLGRLSDLRPNCCCLNQASCRWRSLICWTNQPIRTCNWTMILSAA